MMNGQTENVWTCQHLSSPLMKCVCLQRVFFILLNKKQHLHTRDAVKSKIGRLSEDLVNRAGLMARGCRDTCLLMSETEWREHACQLHALVQDNFSTGERGIFSWWHRILNHQTGLTPMQANSCAKMISSFYLNEVVKPTDPVVSLFAVARAVDEENVQRNVLQSINKIKKAAEIFKDWLRPWLSEWNPVSLETQYRVIDDFEHIVDTLVQQVKEAGEKCITMIKEIVTRVTRVSNNSIDKTAASSEIKAMIDSCKEEVDGLAKLATERMEEYTRRHISTHHVVSQIMIAVKA